MASTETAKGHTEFSGAALRTNVQLGGSNNPENNLSQLRTQYLTEIFALSPDTADTIAFLAFGGEA